LPFFVLYEQIQIKQLTHDIKMPKFMFALFNGGKTNSSKVKFKRFYLIVDFGVDDVAAGKDAQLIYYKIAAAIKKGVASHKLGEAGFKLNA